MENPKHLPKRVSRLLRGEVVALVTNFLILLRHPFFCPFCGTFGMGYAR